MKIIADRSKCVGAGQCVMVARRLFGQSPDDGLVVINVESPDESERDLVELALRSCPSLALKVDE